MDYFLPTAVAPIDSLRLYKSLDENDFNRWSASSGGILWNVGNRKRRSCRLLQPQQHAVLSVPVSDSIHIHSGLISKFFGGSFGILLLFYWEPQKNFKRNAGEIQ